MFNYTLAHSNSNSPPHLLTPVFASLNVLANNETSSSPTRWIKEQALPVKPNEMETNNITEIKMFFGIVILLSFLVTNALIYSFTLKVFLFENSNQTLSFDSWNENNEWSSNSFLIKNLCRFYVTAIKKGAYE